MCRSVACIWPDVIQRTAYTLVHIEFTYNQNIPPTSSILQRSENQFFLWSGKWKAIIKFFHWIYNISQGIIHSILLAFAIHGFWHTEWSGNSIFFIIVSSPHSMIYSPIELITNRFSLRKSLYWQYNHFSRQ